jgi:hypothetical protein
MTRELKLNSRAGRLIALALLTLAVAIPSSVFAGRAGAGWQLATTRSRDAGAVRITSNSIDGLYPAAKRTLLLTLHNPDSKRAVRVRWVRVRDVRTTKDGCAPTNRNLRIRQPRARLFSIRPRGTKRVKALLVMPSSVANACQGAVFQLRYRAATWR